MHEIHPRDLHTLTVGVRLWGALTYEPKQPRFHAARKALHRLGGIYRHEVRAWSLPVSDDAMDALTRLYHRTTLALYIAESGGNDHTGNVRPLHKGKLMTTTIDSTVAQNVRHYLRDTKPSEFADWLNLTAIEAIRLLDGEQSFTVDQLATITHRTGVHTLCFVLTPGQQWEHQLRAALTKYTTIENALWSVLGDMSKRTDVLGNETVHHARELVTDALQMVITGQGEPVDVESKIRDATMDLNAA